MTLMPLSRTRSRAACGRGRRSCDGEELQSRISACRYRVLARWLIAGAPAAAACALGASAALAAAPASAAENSRRFTAACAAERIWTGNIASFQLLPLAAQQLSRGVDLRSPGYGGGTRKRILRVPLAHPKLPARCRRAAATCATRREE